MLKSSDYSELAGSLATVAIASLGGPMSAVGAVLAGVVKHAQGRYEASAPTRDLRRQVSSGIRQWADSEKLTTEEVNCGLALAVQSVARFGPDIDVIAALNFDPQKASRRVLDGARAADSYWGTEDQYEVATRAVEETYRILIEQFRASEKVLLPAIQAMRDSIDDYASRVEASSRNTLVTLDDLVSALIEAGTVGEVMAYLRTRIADWDVSVWHPDRQAPSTLERRLRVRAGREPSTGDPEMTAEDAPVNKRMMVVLGGPGSGKTWLAHRYARQAAQAALSRLEDGADLEEVELPLFTTWDQWTKTPGTTRQSLIAASFASGLGHSDLEWGDSIDRLQRTFTRQGTKVLLILDSLDEAADRVGQGNRLYEVTAMSGWRVVVTSRPAAWDATFRGDPNRPDAPTVVQLQDLTYPADVENFIKAWFAKDAGRGDALIRQIRDRPDLALVAVVPLMLTFYCLLTEPPASVDQPLPARRRDLYQRLVKRLLVGRWVPDAPAAPDEEYCVGLLTDWAWHAVQDCITPTGLGDWGDSFQQPTRPREGQSRAIDHVAPKVMEDDEGRITRRFVHRTVLEHFVAEHITTLEADEAARILLPHLWFDPDWKVVAPAAIAAHNQRQRGALLQQLLDQAVHPTRDPARQVAGRELDKLLLAIAEQSKPGDWAPEHEGLFHACRERNATRELAAVAGTAHWAHSNQSVRTAMLNALPTADERAVGDLVAALPVLEPTEADRAVARTVLLNVLPTASTWATGNLVAALLALEPTEADRAQARTVLLNALPTANTWAVRDLVAALPALVTTEADRAQARTALLNALPDVNPGAVGALVAGLPALVTTEADRAQARTALLTAVPNADPGAVHDLVAALPALVTTEAERAQARTALLTALPNADPRAVHDLAAGLPALEPTEADLAAARAALFTALPNADPRAVGDLVAALLALELTEADLAAARAALFTVLPIADTWAARYRVAALLALEPTEADLAAARAALFTALPNADPGAVGDLVAALPALVTTEAERAQARAALLTALPTAIPGVVRDLVAGLPALEPTETDRAQARAALFTALPTADPLAVRALVAALPALVTTEADRTQARTALLNALPSANTWTVGDLVAALPALVTTEADRAQAVAALLNALPSAKPWAVGPLVAALPAVVTTEADRAQAVAALLNALPTADPSVVLDLIAALRSVSPVQSWLAWLANQG